MFRQTYDSMNRQLVPEKQLVETTLRYMEDARNGIRWVAPVRHKRGLSTVVALAVVLCISLTAVAAAVPGFREMLFQSGSAVGESLTPVLAEAENNGFRLEVLGTMNTEDTFSVYFTLQDTEGKDRLSKSTMLDSIVQLNGDYPEDGVQRAQGAQWYERVLEYDPATQTALCRLDFDSNGTYDVSGSTVKLNLVQGTRTIETQDYIPLEVGSSESETLPVYGHYGYAEGDETPTYIRLDGPLPPAKTGRCPEYSLSEWEDMDFTGFEANFHVLKPSDGYTLPGAEDIRITASGFVNGKFGIQAYLPGKSGYSNPYTDFDIICAEAGKGREIAERMIELRKEGGNSEEIYQYRSFKSASMISFDLDSKGRTVAGPGYNAPGYTDFLFEINPNELENYEFFAYTITREETDIGTQIEFPLGEALPDSLAVYGPMLVGDVRIDKLEITPMGVFISGYRDDEVHYKGVGSIRDVELVCGDTIVPYRVLKNSGYFESQRSLTGYGECITTYMVGSVRYLTDAQPVDAKEVTALRINGVEKELPGTNASEGYEALWQAGMDIREVTLMGTDGLRITGTNVNAEKIQTVQVLCEGETIDADSEGSFGGGTAYAWTQEPEETNANKSQSAHYRLQKTVDPDKVTGVEINGILITEIGQTKF